MNGKILRLARIMDVISQKTCIVPMDHGTTLGPIPGIANSLEVIAQVVAGGADALVLHKGLLRMVSQKPELAKGRYLLHLSVSTSLGPDPNRKVLVSSVAEAIKLGADGISIHVNIGTATEAEMIQDLGQVSAACLEWGMPLLAMMYSKKAQKSPEQIAHAARLGQELGADIVKIDYPGSIADTEKLVKGVQVPVVIAGGSKMDRPQDLLQIIHDALSAGAAGVSIGRNIFQHENPRLITEIVSNLIHGKLSLPECVERLKFPY
jgi:predicted phospho-2-dehydro-3-deoxyheptonate aldolase